MLSCRRLTQPSLLLREQARDANFAPLPRRCFLSLVTLSGRRASTCQDTSEYPSGKGPADAKQGASRRQGGCVQEKGGFRPREVQASSRWGRRCPWEWGSCPCEWRLLPCERRRREVCPVRSGKGMHTKGPHQARRHQRRSPRGDP